MDNTELLTKLKLAESVMVKLCELHGYDTVTSTPEYKALQQAAIDLDMAYLRGIPIDRFLSAYVNRTYEVYQSFQENVECTFTL